MKITTETTEISIEEIMVVMKQKEESRKNESQEFRGFLGSIAEVVAYVMSQQQASKKENAEKDQERRDKLSHLVEGIAAGFNKEMDKFVRGQGKEGKTDNAQKKEAPTPTDREKRKAEIAKAIQLVGWVNIFERIKTNEDGDLFRELQKEYHIKKADVIDKQLKDAGISF